MTPDMHFDRHFDRHFDVVVIGGGPHGLTYATWLKRWRPETRVAVVERAAEPGFKIGESLLSSATRSFIAAGLPMPVLRRLFGNKAGIRFWWTGPETARLHRHLDAVDIEETFQVERRMLEIAMQEAAARRGIELFRGVKVDVSRSELEGPAKRIRCEGPDGPFWIRCRMVCDASGPASVLGRHFGVYRKAPERSDTFTTNAYYAYFRQKRDVPVRFWQEPTTRHVCFPGGWMWFIDLVSWERTPEEPLRRMVRHLLDLHAAGSDAPDEAFPSRHELAARFGCTPERIVSAGFTVRDDHDDTRGMSVPDRFRHYVARHPGIARLMEHYELVEDPYGPHTTFRAFSNLVHDSSRYAGDGWCLIGDAAAFVNPLFSPGLNLGAGGCYAAAQATVAALDRGDLSRDAFAAFERYVADVYEAVLHETDLYYRAFAHVDAYEAALRHKLVYGAADVIQRDYVYAPGDLNVHGLLNPDFRAQVDAARAVLRAGEEHGTPSAEVAAAVRAQLEPFALSVLARPDVRRLGLEDVFSDYAADGRRVARKRRHRAAFGFRVCPSCDARVDRALARCPVCGTPAPNAHRRAA